MPPLRWLDNDIPFWGNFAHFQTNSLLVSSLVPTWRIIAIGKWLVTPCFSHLGHLEVEQPYLGDLLTNHDYSPRILVLG